MKRIFLGAATTILMALFVAFLLSGVRNGPGEALASPKLPDPTLDVVKTSQPATETAVFAGGCFWGVEAVFEHVKGVKTAVSGYAGGKTTNPTYDDVSSGETGHAESVRVTYDPSQVSYGQLLKVFFSAAHDPTQLNRQGPDEGTQYRSAIFYTTGKQKEIAQAYIRQLTQAKTFTRPIVTEVAPLKTFYEAEDYHQDYLKAHPNQPYIVINDKPKVEFLRTEFPGLFKK